MAYRYAVERQKYGDLSSGRVLMGRPGFTAFPVRLADELFQRACRRLAASDRLPPYRLYDPCCGSGYLLTVLGLLHGESIAWMRASDVDSEAVALAERNLSLLTPAGLGGRLEDIQEMVEQYGKDSHRAALESGRRLQAQRSAALGAIDTGCSRFDIAGPHALPAEIADVDLVVSDLPYGRTSRWSGSAEPASAVQRLLTKIEAALSHAGVVCLVDQKQQTVSHPSYRRSESFHLGRRRVFLLERVAEPQLQDPRSASGQ